MEYKGYKIEQNRDILSIYNIRDFNLKHTFECGQCFRWIKQADESYTGVAFGKVINVALEDGVLTIRNTSADDFANIWFDYFDLGRDYSIIKKKVCKDNTMKEAVSFGYGIRLLKQELWEILISFIISANNRIPMIMRTVENISKEYGNQLTYDGKSYYTFPQIEKLMNCREEELRLCGGGFRCKYIVKSISKLINGEVRLSELDKMSTVEARNYLTKLDGVGEKVSDCTLLFSGTKYDVFPTDVWVKRVMEELYFKREAGFKEIQSFAKSYFEQYSGIAQQYLFYYARENKIGTDSKAS